MRVGRARLLLLLAAFGWAVMAVGFYQAVESEELVPEFWPFLFTALSILTLMFAVTLSESLRVVTGAAIVASFVGRVWATFVRADAGVIDMGRAVTAAGLYAVVGMLVWVTWVYVLGPVVSWNRQSRGL